MTDSVERVHQFCSIHCSVPLVDDFLCGRLDTPALIGIRHALRVSD